MSDDFLHSVDSRVEDVAVEGEAVGGPIRVGRDGATEAIQIDLLVAIVELEDVADAANGLKILVAIGVEEVQRVHISRVTVRKGEVESHGEIDLAPTKDILEEGMLALDLEVLKLK